MNDYSHRRIVWIRAFLGYLCLLAIFSSFLICVHLSLQEKRLRYVMSEKLSERTKLLRDVSVTRAQVDNLRRLERLEQICEEQLIPLAPPEFPVLILPETPTGEASQEFDEPDNVQKSPPSPADLGSIACASKQKAID